MATSLSSDDPLTSAELALKDALQALELARQRQHKLEEDLCTAVRASDFAEHSHALSQEHRPRSRSKLPRAPISDGSAWLCSDVVMLRVDADNSSAHLGVLQKSPYFAARLERWDTGTVLDLTLPDGCGVSDMLDVLQHMYCPGLRWSLVDAMAGLRAAAIADLWQLDDMLPELGKAVSAKVSSDDIFEVRAALSAPWPPAFLEPLRCFLREGDTLDQPAVHQMVKGAISNAATDNAFRAACAIFASYNKAVLADIVVDVILEVIDENSLGNLRVEGLHWLLSTLVEHTSPKQAEPVFAKIADMHMSTRCGSCYSASFGHELSHRHVSTIRKSYEAHIKRCVTHDDVSVAFSLGVQRIGLCPCGASLSDNVLAFSCKQGFSLAHCCSQSQVGLVAGLLTLKPSILRPLLTPELLALLPAEDQKALVEKLATDLSALHSWAVSQCWPWGIRHLSRLPWPARLLTELAFPYRCLAKVPWASAEPAARSLQPFLLKLPRDVCTMLVSFCAAADDRFNTTFKVSRNISQTRRLFFEVCAALSILSVQLGIGMFIAAVMKWAANFLVSGQDWALDLAPSMMTALTVVFAETLLGMRGIIGIYYIVEPVIGVGAETCFAALGLAALLPLQEAILRYSDKVNIAL